MGRRGLVVVTAAFAGITAGSAIVWASRPSARAASGVLTPPLPSTSPHEGSPAASPGSPCDRHIGKARAAADDLLANRFTIARFPAVTLPADLRWDEDPLSDPQWLYNLHTLRFTNALWEAWSETGDVRYRDRYEFFLRDWYEKNPRTDAPSRWSWSDHSTAWRGIVYTCALERLPGRAWARDAAMLHGRVLADPSFYVRHGNHALNQSIALLELGCALDQPGWRATAMRRMAKLAAESIDEQGVTNEQAIGYQWYNYRRYSKAVAAIRACGLRPPTPLARVDHMLEFLRFAALPNGRWELIGDTHDDRRNLPDGPPPDQPAAMFDAGFAFVRSGWGETRAFEDETALALRFGPDRRFHGHTDAAALTVYAYGDRILIDPGLYRYRHDAYRNWFTSGEAHNTIAVDGRPMEREGSTRLLAWRDTPAWTYAAVEHRKIPGVAHTRRVFYSRALDLVVVDDDVRSARANTVRQWWHLHPDARTRLTADGFYTGRPGSRANAWVVQLSGRVRQNVVRGSKRPIQGWVSFDYGQLDPADAVSVRKTGARVRFLTLIVPSPSSARSWTVRSFEERADGFVLVIERGGVRQRITVAGRIASAS